MLLRNLKKKIAGTEKSGVKATHVIISEKMEYFIMLQAAFDAFNGQNYSEARELFETLSEQNNPTALSSLGFMYQQGLGMDADLTKAYEYYSRAADLDEPTALFNLALMYADGVVVTHDQFKAHELLIRSAILNFPQAQYEAALSLDRGLGCVQNFSEAAFWYEEAAKRGHAGAFNNLGVLTQRGAWCHSRLYQSLYLFFPRCET